MPIWFEGNVRRPLRFSSTLKTGQTWKIYSLAKIHIPDSPIRLIFIIIIRIFPGSREACTAERSKYGAKATGPNVHKSTHILIKYAGENMNPHCANLTKDYWPFKTSSINVKGARTRFIYVVCCVLAYSGRYETRLPRQSGSYG